VLRDEDSVVVLERCAEVVRLDVCIEAVVGRYEIPVSITDDVEFDRCRHFVQAIYLESTDILWFRTQHVTYSHLDEASEIVDVDFNRFVMSKMQLNVNSLDRVCSNASRFHGTESTVFWADELAHCAGGTQRVLARVDSTAATFTAVTVQLEPKLAKHPAHLRWANVLPGSTTTNVAPTIILLEPIFTKHRTHDLVARRLLCTFASSATRSIVLVPIKTMSCLAFPQGTFIAIANVAAILVFLETEFTISVAHEFIAFRLFFTIAHVATEFVFLEAELAISRTHDFVALWCLVTIANVATIFVFLEAKFTVSCTHEFVALWCFLTIANVATIFVFLETGFTISCTHEFVALWCFTLADVTAIIVFLETMVTVACTNEVVAHRLISTFTNVAAFVVLLEAMIAHHHTHRIRARRRNLYMLLWYTCRLTFFKTREVILVSVTASVDEGLTLITLRVVEYSAITLITWPLVQWSVAFVR